MRRLSLETDQLSSELGQAIAARQGAVRAARILLDGVGAASRQNGLAAVFDELQSAYPELEWLAIADTDGRVARTNGALTKDSRVDSAAWFTQGMQGPWLGVIGESAAVRRSRDLRCATSPVQIIGVVAAHLSWQRAPNHPLRLTDESDPKSRGTGVRARSRRNRGHRTVGEPRQAMGGRSVARR